MNKHTVVTQIAFSLTLLTTCCRSSVTRNWREERESHGGLKSLAGVLMDVTMTTRDPLGEGGSERS